MILLAPDLKSQGHWEWINPKPHGIGYADIFSLSSEAAIGLSQDFVTKTNDGGKSWKTYQVSDPKDFIPGNLEALYFINPSVGWVVGRNGTVYKTTDGGVTWQQIQNHPIGGFYSVHFINQHIGWVAGRTQISRDGVGFVLKTTDGGLTWDEQIIEETMRLVDLSFVDDYHGWAAGRGGKILSTSDQGKTWEVFDSITDSSIAWSESIYFLNLEDGWLLAKDSHLSNPIVKRTNDGGMTWNKVIIDASSPFESIYFSNETTGWLVGRQGTIYYSTDSGNSWKKYEKITDESFSSIHFSDNESGWIAGSNGILLNTQNGGNKWNLKGERSTSSTLNSVYFLNESTGWIVSDRGDILKTENAGSDWQQLNSPTDLSLYAIYFWDANTGWVGDPAANIYKTTDGGLTWTQQALQETGRLVENIQFHNSTLGWAMTEKNLFMTQNGGENWGPVASFPNELNSMEFLSDKTGWLVTDGGIYKTMDGGLNWQLDSGSLDVDESISFNVVQFLDFDNGWVLGGRHHSPGYAVKTTNGGEDWQEVLKDSLGEIYTASFVDMNTGWAAGWGGGFTTTNDGGRSWRCDKSIYTEIRDIHFQNSAHGIAVGYAGTIVKYIPDGTVSVESNDESLYGPSYTQLSQNYPNPFNPNTEIRYDLPTEVHVRLDIFNVLGQRITTLVDEVKPAGSYAANWHGKNQQGRDVAGGLYFYQMTIGRFSQTKKMLLLR